MEQRFRERLLPRLRTPSLRDPAQGFENYGQEGAHRVKETVIFVRNDSEAAPIYRIEDGTIMKEGFSGEYDRITEVLARRTHDENGNYKVEGLDLRDRGSMARMLSTYLSPTVKPTSKGLR